MGSGYGIKIPLALTALNAAVVGTIRLRILDPLTGTTTTRTTRTTGTTILVSGWPAPESCDLQYVQAKKSQNKRLSCKKIFLFANLSGAFLLVAKANDRRKPESVFCYWVDNMKAPRR